MGAREYDPSLARWLSADTIVPNPANSQSLNRYAYVLGNPLKYIDPTGHISDDPHERREAANIIEELSYYGVTIDVDWGWDGENWNEGSWLLGELNLVLQSVKDLAAKISEELDNDLEDWDNFRKVVGPVTVRRERSWALSPDRTKDRPARTYGNTIILYNGTFDPYGPASFDYEGTKGTIVHELGHAWNNNQDGVPADNIGWYTAGEESPTFYGEDNSDSEKWAELVACWVYKSQVDEGRTLRPRHQQYVSLMVHLSYLGACPTRPAQSK